jgi:hypothetical protein
VRGISRVLDRTEALRLHMRFSGLAYDVSFADTGVGMDAATMGRVFRAVLHDETRRPRHRPRALNRLRGRAQP